MLTFRFSGADGCMVVAETLTTGMVGKEVKLEFTADWDGLSKTAVFMAGEVTRDVAGVSGTAVIPAEVLAVPLQQLYVGIYGVSGDGTVTPTIRAAGPVILPGIDPSGDAGTEPDLPVWAQLQTRIDDLQTTRNNYYCPVVEQPGEDILEFSWQPSNASMPAVPSASFVLPGAAARNAVLHVSQTLTALQQAQARTNISAQARTPEIADTVVGETAMAFSGLMDGTDQVESFIHFADPHFLNSLSGEGQMRTYLDAVKLYHDVTPASFVICSGDWFGNGDTHESACFKLAYIDGWMRRQFGDRYCLAVGNHDTNQQGVDDTGAAWTGLLPVETVRNLWFRQQGSNYYAFDGTNTRFYILDTWREYYAMTDYGWEQVAWLAEQLKADDPAHAAIVMHIGYMVDEDGSPCTFAFPEYVLALCRAFNNAGSITLNGNIYNFTGCTGKVGFALCGHIHTDYASVVSGIPLIALTHMRDGNVPTFDLCLADYGSNTLHLVRVGTGESRQIPMATADDPGADIQYTNLVPAAGSPSADEIFNGTGYMDNYACGNVPDTGYVYAAEGYVATGIMPYTVTANYAPTIYIKGSVELDNTIDCKVLFWKENKIYLNAQAYLTDGQSISLAVEKRSAGYYKLAPVYMDSGLPAMVNNFGMGIAGVSISVKGVGSGLIVTMDEPIEADAGGEAPEEEAMPVRISFAGSVAFVMGNHTGAGLDYGLGLRAVAVSTADTGVRYLVGNGTPTEPHYALQIPTGCTRVTVNCPNLKWVLDVVGTDGYRIAGSAAWMDDGTYEEIPAESVGYYLLKFKMANDAAFTADFDPIDISWTFA